MGVGRYPVSTPAGASGGRGDRTRSQAGRTRPTREDLALAAGCSGNGTGHGVCASGGRWTRHREVRRHARPSDAFDQAHRMHVEGKRRTR
jgi:hypothetical protein